MWPFDVNEANPADDGIVSQFPAGERASRAAIEGSSNVEHVFATGRHKFGSGTTAQRDAFSDWNKGSVWINTDDPDNPTPQWQKNAAAPFAWEDLSRGPVGEFASGTKMLFLNATAPTGWTPDTGLNDRVLRVVDGPGGGTGGSWTVGGLTVDNHALTVAELPPHTHSQTRQKNPTGSGTFTWDFRGQDFAGLETVNTGSTGSGAGHNHGLTSDGSWRPAYVNAIPCVKD